MTEREIAQALLAVRNSLDHATGIFHDLRNTMVERTDSLAKIVRQTRLGLWALLVLLVAFILGFGSVVLSNRNILQTVQCAVQPGCEISRGLAERRASQLTVVEDNLRCELRRALAGHGPAPDPAIPCRDQTPPEVYASPLCALPPGQNPCRDGGS